MPYIFNFRVVKVLTVFVRRLSSRHCGHQLRCAWGRAERTSERCVCSMVLHPHFFLLVECASTQRQQLVCGIALVAR
jgi:hypothetical protein